MYSEGSCDRGKIPFRGQKKMMDVLGEFEEVQSSLLENFLEKIKNLL